MCGCVPRHAGFLSAPPGADSETKVAVGLVRCLRILAVLQKSIGRVIDPGWRSLAMSEFSPVDQVFRAGHLEWMQPLLNSNLRREEFAAHWFDTLSPEAGEAMEQEKANRPDVRGSFVQTPAPTTSPPPYHQPGRRLRAMPPGPALQQEVCVRQIRGWIGQ